MSKNIIISFDYELFFGDEPGTVQNSIITPTNNILNALDMAGGKATFFVDYLMIKYMQRENEATRNDANMLIEQLQNIVRRGHRIELHIHPHWVDAKYKDGKWDFSDFTHYCLNSFSEDEITEMFIEGTSLLESIARKVVPDYKIIAYRAGGWAILPFEKMVEGFSSAGIRVDSSLIYGKKFNVNGYTLDFSDAPSECVYNFSNDVKCIDNQGRFIEAQIGSFQHNIFSTVINLLYHRNHPELFRKLADGSHFRSGTPTQKAEKMSKWNLLHQHMTFCLAGLPSFLLNYFIRKNTAPFVVVISHPKDITPITCQNIVGLKNFNFCTYNDLL